MSVRYKPYPEYKSSGVEWVGDVPNHWTITRVQDFSALFNGFPFDSKKFDPEQGFPLVRIRDLNRAKTETCYKGDFVKAASITSDDVLIGMDGDFNVGRWLGDGFGLLNQRMCCIRGETDILSRLLEYGIPIPLLLLNDITYATTVKHLSSYQVEKIKFPLSSPSEQRAIASFLDRETGKIDRLIGKQERMIQLLKEKRQAVISLAVTKGLNPDVAMKDSGIEWLGEIPEHWDFKPLRFLGSCQNGINIGAESFGSGFPFISYGDVYNHRTLPDIPSGLVQSTADDRERYSLKVGDVLFTRTSETLEEIGFASACLCDIPKVCFAGFLIRFRPHTDDLDVEFSKHYFSSQLLRAFFSNKMNLVTRASLSQDLLKMMPVVVPPRVEQRKIAEHLDAKNVKFAHLIANAKQAIELMKERRTALISAAVTGKIDVREAV